MDQRRSCCNLCQIVFCLYFPLSFIASSLAFRSLIYFEFIFCVCYKGVFQGHVRIQQEVNHLQPKKHHFWESWWFKQLNLIFQSVGDCKCKIKVPAGSVFDKSALLRLQMTFFFAASSHGLSSVISQ